MEALSNNAQTTLSGSLNNSATSLTVASASGFPSSGNYRVIVDGEILLVTAGQGTTTWTVSRGQESTAAASHASGATVTQVLTAGAVNQILQDLIQVGTYANLPSASAVRAGTLYLATDSPVVSRSDGSSWSSWAFGCPVTLPVSGNFSWVNQGAATVDATKGFVYLSAASTGATENDICRVVAAPATPYTVTMMMVFNCNGGNFGGGGLVWRDSASGKLVRFLVFTNNAALSLAVTKANSPTSFNADYTSVSAGYLGVAPAIWLQVSDDGTNRICRYSMDGVNFQQLHTIGRTDFLTANQVGFFIYTGGSPVGLSVLSWSGA